MASNIEKGIAFVLALVLMAFGCLLVVLACFGILGG
jgi:hypothetical protein